MRTRYLLDANVFIEAKNRHYGFDFCPAFWDWLVEKNGQGLVASIDQVRSELAEGDDDLSAWVKDREADFFLSSESEAVQASSRLVSDWVYGQKYEQAGIAGFLDKADPWLVAHGLAEGFVIVTHEIPSNSSKRIKIPDVCQALKVLYATPFQMLRSEGAKFVL